MQQEGKFFLIFLALKYMWMQHTDWLTDYKKTQVLSECFWIWSNCFIKQESKLISDLVCQILATPSSPSPLLLPSNYLGPFSRSWNRQKRGYHFTASAQISSVDPLFSFTHFSRSVFSKVWAHPSTWFSFHPRVILASACALSSFLQSNISVSKLC